MKKFIVWLRRILSRPTNAPEITAPKTEAEQRKERAKPFVDRVCAVCDEMHALRAEAVKLANEMSKETDVDVAGLNSVAAIEEAFTRCCDAVNCHPFWVVGGRKHYRSTDYNGCQCERCKKGRAGQGDAWKGA